MLEQAKRMKDKPKYTSMGQYIHPPDSTPDSHLQIGPKNFPFEDRTEPPLHKNTKLGKPTIQALQYCTLYDRGTALFVKDVTNNYLFQSSKL